MIQFDNVSVSFHSLPKPRLSRPTCWDIVRLQKDFHRRLLNLLYHIIGMLGGANFGKLVIRIAD